MKPSEYDKVIGTKITTQSFKKEISKISSLVKPPKYYSLGSKTGNCLLTRLRVGMSKLNAHSFTTQKNRITILPLWKQH